jgi:lipopolysaccharide/colanic/teichoic acid biosynthesis glycosyltransferase
MEASPIRIEAERLHAPALYTKRNGARRRVPLAGSARSATLHPSRNGAGRSVSYAGSASSEIALRVLNVLTATTLLILAFPLMLVIAALVRLSSTGPVLFVQQRVGLDRRNGGRPANRCKRRYDRGGQRFRMYKFRTMYVSSSQPSVEVWAKPDDPRVTPVGRVLRKYRLDELPQLLNVLLGDMNLVGPRPEQPKIFAQLRGQLDRYSERQRVRPGITGWAQVNRRYDRSVEDVLEKLTLDLQYIQRRSVREDLKIMLRTVPVVILKRGAW